MEELENTNPIMDNTGDSPINSKPETNVASSTAEPVTTEPEQAPDFSQLFSENITESTPIQESEPTPSVDTVVSSVDAQQPAPQEADTPSESVSQQTEAPAQEQVQEQPVNIEQEIANTSLDNHQNVQPSQEAIEAQKAKIEQQKLAWLKQHEDKARKSGLTKGIFLGILLTLLLLIAGVLFAKDYIIDGINYIDSLMPKSSQALLNQNNPVIEETETDLSETEESEVIEDENTEEVDPIQEYYNQIDEIMSSEDDQETKAEQLRNILNEVMQEYEEPDEELTQLISQTIMDLTINSEEEMIQENIEDQENSEEVDNPEIDNEISESTEEVLEDTESIEDDKGYTITHVNSEEEANWVLPAHCSDLTCYGENKEFIACNKFRVDENLDENSKRIRSSGACKYKDNSELVYVEFSDVHNSAEDTDYSANTEAEPTLEMNESIQE